ncbi:MAG: prephenate dehydratase [Armatimonadetes bacterium]|nr:prephenate dehydratase [Armatimonadota bacterium]
MANEQDSKRTVEQVRGDIDALDSELIQLLERRVHLAQEIGNLKGLEKKPFFTPERERQIYERLQEKAKGQLGPEQLVNIFREIISAARAAEKPLTVAFWGPPGTYSNQAVEATFGHSVVANPVNSIREVFLSVERGQSDYGVVPIENTIGGVVPETLDMFPVTNVKICAETFIDIHHHLGTLADDLSKIERVYAGPQPASQCRRWLQEHIPAAQVVEVVPTSRAAEKALNDPQGAAIANRICLDMLGLPAIAERIEDHAKNQTRFVVLGHNEPAPSGRDKTTITFHLKNRPGELYRVLGCFVDHGVNLTMIESRPSPRESFSYLFYVDMVGHREDTEVMQAINDMRSVASETIILGSYPSYDEKLANR